MLADVFSSVNGKNVPFAQLRKGSIEVMNRNGQEARI